MILCAGNLHEVKPVLQNIRTRLEELSTVNKTLCGWCAVSAYVVFHVMRRRGFQDLWVCTSAGHAFNRCCDYYIDLTATQFNDSWAAGTKKLPPVYVSTEPAEALYFNKSVHDIVDKTDRAKDIWTKTCRSWNRPIRLKNPVIVDLIKNA